MNLQMQRLHPSFICNGDASMCRCLRLYLLALVSSFQLHLITSVHVQLQHLQLMMFHTLKLQQTCMSTLSEQCMCAYFCFISFSIAAAMQLVWLHFSFHLQNCNAFQQTWKNMRTCTPHCRLQSCSSPSSLHACSK